MGSTTLIPDQKFQQSMQPSFLLATVKQNLLWLYPWIMIRTLSNSRPWSAKIWTFFIIIQMAHIRIFLHLSWLKSHQSSSTLNKCCKSAQVGIHLWYFGFHLKQLQPINKVYSCWVDWPPGNETWDKMDSFLL